MKGERLILSLFSDADRPEVLDMFQQPNAFKYIAPLANLNTSQYQSFLDLKLNQIETKTGYYFITRQLETNKFIGAINLTPIPKTELIQIGWQIKNEFQGFGFATEASNLVLQFAKSKTSFTPIYAVFTLDNIASQRIVEKLNFTFDKEIRSQEEVLLRYFYHI